MKKGEKKKEQKALGRREERRDPARSARSETTARSRLGNLRGARSYELLGCWTQRGWQEQGLTTVVVARRQPDGRITFASFVVDFFCLGVKDAMALTDLPHARFMREVLPGLTQDMAVKSDPAVAHELVYGSIEYAARWGFRPHSDFRLAQMVLDPAGTYPPSGQVTFGRDGKPVFIPGPYDNPQNVVRQLRRTAGEGNFEYIAVGGLAGLSAGGPGMMQLSASEVEMLRPVEMWHESDSIWERIKRFYRRGP